MGKNRNETVNPEQVSTLGFMLACRYGLENAISKAQSAMENGIRITVNRMDLNYYDFNKED